MTLPDQRPDNKKQASVDRKGPVRDGVVARAAGLVYNWLKRIGVNSKTRRGIRMIRVTFAYPHEEGKKFDWDYFSGKHLPLVHEHLDSLGLTKVEADKGISGTDPSSNPPFEAVVHMTFGTVDEVHEAFKAAGRPILGDLGNYTDIKPTIQISETVA